MNKIYILFLLIIQVSFSQNVEIVYDLIPKVIEKNASSEEVQKIIDEISNSKEQFLLRFNQSTSVFSIHSILSEDEELPLGKKLNRIMIGYNPYYYSKKENTFYYEKDGFVVKKPNNVKWETTAETKKIDNYTCYKAIYKEKIINRLGEEKIREIVAWFTPDLPYSYGPLEFNGLPGLILELEKLGCKLVAKSIVIDKNKTIEIEKPKGKTINEEEYKEKLKRNFE